MTGYKILAYTSPEAERRLRKALPADDLRMALTYQEATSAVFRQDWDVVLIGAMFDESRGLQLMELMSSGEAMPKVPIVGIRGAKLPLFVSPQAFDLPMTSLGAVDIIDFASIADDDAGNAEIGERIRAAAAGKSTL